MAGTWAVLCFAAAWVVLGFFATTTRCGGGCERNYLLYLFWIGHCYLSVVKTLCDGIFET